MAKFSIIDWTLDRLEPFLTYVADFRLMLGAPVIQDDFVAYLKKRLRIGMVLLSYEKGAFTNIFNRGYWKHAAVYVGKGKVVEATHLGVRFKDLDKFCLDKDRLTALKPKFCKPQDMLKAVQWVISWIGRKYDFRFSVKNKAKYCVEVAIDSYLKACSWFKPKKLKVGKRIVYTPDLLYFDDKNWEVVCNSEIYYRNKKK